MEIVMCAVISTAIASIAFMAFDEFKEFRRRRELGRTVTFKVTPDVYHLDNESQCPLCNGAFSPLPNYPESDGLLQCDKCNTVFKLFSDGSVIVVWSTSTPIKES